MDNEDRLTLDRKRLSIGKYTRWAANLSEEEMYGLLWLLGEFGIRTSRQNLLSSIQEVGRARTGLLCALDYIHGNALTEEEAKHAIRNCYKSG